MGLRFLTLGDSIDVVRFPGCPTPSDWCVVRSKDGDVQCFCERMSWLVERRFWSEEKGLSPGPEAWLSRARSQCQRHWERWLGPARHRVAAHVRSIQHAHVDHELSGSLKSQGFRRQYKGFCQARAPFAASHPVNHGALKVVLYSQVGGRGSARYQALHLESRDFMIFLCCLFFSFFFLVLNQHFLIFRLVYCQIPQYRVNKTK